MPAQTPLPTTLERLAKLLRKAQTLATPPKEKTLFSLGGKGHYENPASDLLGFFFDPAAEHNFGTLFLKAFFDCMGVDAGRMDFGEVSVQREVRTVEGKLIDLLVRGRNWVLVIENKIHHIQNNPFQTYESHVEKLRFDDAHFAVLSPSGTSAAPEKWKPVSYKNYCRAVRNYFADATFDLPHSKWMVFAREFVLHFENELYNPVMTTEQFKFVEEHLLEIEELKAMFSEYTTQLISEFQKGLREALPQLSNVISVVDQGWALRCVIQPNRFQVALQTPRNKEGNTQRKFRMIVYLCGLTVDQDQQVSTHLAAMKRGSEGKWSFWHKNGPDNSGDVIEELCSIVQTLNAVISN